MYKLITLGLSAALTFSAAQAAEPSECQKVRIADLGWTDIMLTNGGAEFILNSLGYEPKQTLLGLNVTYVSLKNKEIDVFQGNWRPLQDEQYQAYFDDGSVEVLATNLEGAKNTLAVPKYVSDGGVKDFADLAAHGEQFDKKIYGIEPGSNWRLLDMVATNRYGLAGWEIVESSEAGMLTQVKKAAREKQWIAFFAWAPHPMNLDYDLTYLSGGDKEFGPNFGASIVRTITRKGYARDCPNVAALFSNLTYTVDYENQGMQLIMAQGKDPVIAAQDMMKQNPQMLEKWLQNVTTFDGKPGLPVVKAALGL